MTRTLVFLSFSLAFAGGFALSSCGANNCAATCNGWSEMLAGNIAARLGETNVEVAA